MLEAMRRLALDSLWVELDGANHQDPEVWYRGLRQSNPGRLFSKLVENVEESSSSGKDTPRYYTLKADPDSDDTTILEVHEFKPGDASRLPFNQPSGSQSAALGPIIKRTAPSKAKEAGPTAKIQETTLAVFTEIGKQGRSWSPYFREAHACLMRKTLRFKEKDLTGDAGAFRSAVRAIDEKRTVLLAFQDKDGRLPGEVPEYVDYLQNVLANTKYATGQIIAHPQSSCALCGLSPTTVYPNALRGAGINLANLDRDGAFPGIDASHAWKGYSLCVACADLLYVYWNHVAAEFLVTVAGEKALIIPETTLDPKRRRDLIKRARELAREFIINKDQVPLRENKLLRLLSDDNVVTTLTFIWAEFGQRIDDVRGVVTDVLPSRLSGLTKLNEEFATRNHPLFPDVALDEFKYDLTLNTVRPLLRRPGGKKAQAVNDSRRLFELRRDLAEAVYHRAPLPERLWDEVHQTARWHWDEVCAQGNAWNALYEGFSTKKNVGYLTLAGWVRQLARFLAYLRHVGVIMAELKDIYQPTSERLKTYFTAESAIDSKDKAFTFILGVLYGKLLQVQAGRGVNVAANALTWLRRLSLSGNDLPELYVKIREKLLTYDTEGNDAVRELLTELAELGTRLGNFNLDETTTCYFLLLGQSLAVKILPSKGRDDTQGAGR
jgi:CRISPR-associated protein Csh1